MTSEKEWQKKFIQRLSETGNISASCRKAGITRQRAYQVKDEDVVFNAAWKEALVISVENLEFEARRRAELGVLDPVFHQGEKVGAIRKYSDTLLIFLLKAHKPDMYRDNQHIEHEHKGETVLRVLYGDGDGTEAPVYAGTNDSTS